MRSHPARAVRAAAFLFAACTALATVVRAQTPTRIADIVYAQWFDANNQPHDLLLDLYLPQSPPPTALPLLVWVHGGGWQSGSKFPAPTQQVARGYAVASIDYRLSGTAIWPAQIHDCKAAIRFLRSNAATWNLDPDRIGVFGSSAGGHLVAALGTMGGVGPVRIGSLLVDLEGTIGSNLATSSRVQTVCDMFGPTNMMHAHDFPTFDHDAANSPESLLIGAALPTAPERWASVDPITFVTPDDPPLLLMHGTDDTTVPFHESELLLRAAAAVGLDATLFAVQDTGHGGPGFNAPDAVAAQDAFFDRTLGQLPAVRVSVTATDASAAEAGDPATFVVARTGATTAPLRVRLWLGGDVTPGDDCDPVPLLVTIPAGAASVAVPLVPHDDSLVEGTETATLLLCASPDYRIDHSAAQATATIADDDGTAATTVDVVAIDASAGEPANPGAVRFTRTGPTTAPLTVHYRLAGSATRDVDLQPLSGTATIAAGSQSAVLTVLPRNDTLPEASETAIVTLLADAGYALGANRSAHVVVADDDRPPLLPIVGVIATDPALGEPVAAGAFTLTRTGSTAQPLTVRFAVAGTATAGTDYVALATVATIAAGSAWVRVPVQPIDDLAVEGRESVTLRLLPDPAYAIGVAGESRLWLDDDEAPPVATTLAVAVAPLLLGAPATATIAGGEASAPWSLWYAFADAYLPLPPYGVVLLDLATATGLASGVLGGDGAATMSLAVPDLGFLTGLQVTFQAVALQTAAPGLVLSDAATRTIAGQPLY